ncbi:MAG TPA: hypothetical protein ENK58_02050 [Desulfobacterales bacterium]|nr:hypothetical protein [Desulfobacterales bacterium]
MIVSSKSKELVHSAEFIMRNPHLYGISFDTQEMTFIREVFESLLTSEQWFWINIYDLTRVLEENEFKMADIKVQCPKNLHKKIERGKRLPEKLFLPSDAISGNGPVRLYEELKVALLISGHRRDDFERASVMQIDTNQAIARGLIFEPSGAGIVFARDMADDADIPLTFVKTENRILSELYIQIMFKESVYIEDHGHQSNACRYLYQHLPQEFVENELIRYLNDPDPDVRINVYASLGFPVYSVSIPPDKPMPPWDSLIEPVTLSCKTVGRLLKMMRQEKYPDVLDYAICTLKAQNYAGKLKNISQEVIRTVQEVASRIEGRQTIRDCENLLQRLTAEQPALHSEIG